MRRTPPTRGDTPEPLSRLDDDGAAGEVLQITGR